MYEPSSKWTPVERLAVIQDIEKRKSELEKRLPDTQNEEEARRIDYLIFDCGERIYFVRTMGAGFLERYRRQILYGTEPPN